MAASHSRLVMAETVRSGPDDAKSSGWGQPGGVGALRAPAFRGVQRDPRTTEPFQIRSKRARREHFRFLSEQRELGEGDGVSFEIDAHSPRALSRRKGLEKGTLGGGALADEEGSAGRRATQGDRVARARLQ